MCIYNESVVPQFSLRDRKGTTQEKARGRLKKSFFLDLTAFRSFARLLALSVLLPPKTTAFEKKNMQQNFFFFLMILSSGLSLVP